MLEQNCFKHLLISLIVVGHNVEFMLSTLKQLFCLFSELHRLTPYFQCVLPVVLFFTCGNWSDVVVLCFNMSSLV